VRNTRVPKIDPGRGVLIALLDVLVTRVKLPAITSLV